MAEEKIKKETLFEQYYQCLQHIEKQRSVLTQIFIVIGGTGILAIERFIINDQVRMIYYFFMIVVYFFLYRIISKITIVGRGYSTILKCMLKNEKYNVFCKIARPSPSSSLSWEYIYLGMLGLYSSLFSFNLVINWNNIICPNIIAIAFLDLVIFVLLFSCGNT